jgi:hypothetical protein
VQAQARWRQARRMHVWCQLAKGLLDAQEFAFFTEMQAAEKVVTERAAQRAQASRVGTHLASVEAAELGSPQQRSFQAQQDAEASGAALDAEEELGFLEKDRVAVAALPAGPAKEARELKLAQHEAVAAQKAARASRDHRGRQAVAVERRRHVEWQVYLRGRMLQLAIARGEGANGGGGALGGGGPRAAAYRLALSPMWVESGGFTAGEMGMAERDWYGGILGELEALPLTQTDPNPNPVLGELAAQTSKPLGSVPGSPSWAVPVPGGRGGG